MNMILAIFLGGGAGSVTRHLAVLAGTKVFGDAFPYGTLIVNVLGSFIIGALLETIALKWSVPVETRALLVTGFLGGFTTFSAFSFDVFKLVETGNAVSAMIYVLASVALSLLAVFGGVFLMRGVFA